MGRARRAGEEVGLSTGVAETVSVLMLLAALAAAVIRPWGWPEAVIAVPAAALVVITGAISPTRALDMMKRLGPVIGFLAAVLILAQLCQEEGLFRALGDWLARLARPGRARSSARLLAGVFAVASVVTAVLSLDATVVLLTPVVFAAAAGPAPAPSRMSTAALTWPIPRRCCCRCPT